MRIRICDKDDNYYAYEHRASHAQISREFMYFCVCVSVCVRVKHPFAKVVVWVWNSFYAACTAKQARVQYSRSMSICRARRGCIVPILPEYRASVHLSKGVHPRRTGRKKSLMPRYSSEKTKNTYDKHPCAHIKHTQILSWARRRRYRGFCAHTASLPIITHKHSRHSRARNVFFMRQPRAQRQANIFAMQNIHKYYFPRGRSLEWCTMDCMRRLQLHCAVLSLSLQPFAPLECQPLRAQLYDLLRIYSTWALIRRMVSPPKLVNAFACE